MLIFIMTLSTYKTNLAPDQTKIVGKGLTEKESSEIQRAS
jgi:hypothetical protein